MNQAAARSTAVNEPSRPMLSFSAAIALVAWGLSVVVWNATRQIGVTVSMIGLGVSLGPCLAAYTLARPDRKQAWRQAVMATGGVSILAFALLDAVSLDIEGFFALLFLGTMGAAIGHTTVTTILGPLLFGRVLCGWGCWRGMLLEHLPVGEVSCRRPAGWWSRMPLAGLGLSVGAAAFATFVLHVDPGGLPGRTRGQSLGFVAVAILVYYALSIALAFGLRDRRAFCKYLCPTGQVLRWTSRRSLLAVRSQPGACTDCGACERVCPMGLPLMERARHGGRIADGRCILCQRCVAACSSGALRTGIRTARPMLDCRLPRDSSH